MHLKMGGGSPRKGAIGWRCKALNKGSHYVWERLYRERKRMEGVDHE
jgi:hypothetical protein